MRRLLAPLVLLLAVITGITAFRLGAASPPHTTGVEETPSVQPSPSPTSADTTPTRPGWETAADVFVDAFLDRSNGYQARLKSVTTPRLASLLKRTDPAELPAGQPIGSPIAVVETTAYVTAVQRLSDGSSLTFDLVPDGSCRWGWTVTSVRPGEQ